MYGPGEGGHSWLKVKRNKRVYTAYLHRKDDVPIMHNYTAAAIITMIYTLDARIVN